MAGAEGFELAADLAEVLGEADETIFKFLRAGDRWFGWNFFKGYVTIWYQMVMVIAFGTSAKAGNARWFMVTCS